VFHLQSGQSSILRNKHVLKVGFYIGDREMSPTREVPTFTIGPKSTLSSGFSWMPGSGEPATLSIPSQGEECRYSDLSDAPLLSPSASTTVNSGVLRMGQDGESRSKVKFSVGKNGIFYLLV